MDSRELVNTVIEYRKMVDVIQGCQRCGLSCTRTKTVIGNGPADATIMLIGEAPGRQEDESGRPFVGAAGELLNSLLKECGIDRRDIYVTNIVKCRPPDNRDPELVEIKSCIGWLKREIKMLNPSLIVSLGNPSTRTLLNKLGDRSYPGIGKLRGKLQLTSRGRYLFPTYHPAAALYDDSKIEILKEDFTAIAKLKGNLDAEGPWPF